MMLQAEVVPKDKDNDVSISQVGGVIAVLRSELIVYIQDEFGPKYDYVATLNQNNLSQIVSRLLKEEDAISALSGTGFFAALSAAGTSVVNLASKAHIVKKPTPYFRLPQLSYLIQKADLLEELHNKIHTYSYVDPHQFTEELQQNFAEVVAKLCVELNEFNTSMTALVTKKYSDEIIEAQVGETKHLLYGLLSSGSTLATNLQRKIISQFKLTELSKTVEDHCQLLCQLKKQQFDRFMQSKNTESKKHEQQLEHSTQVKFVLLAAVKKLNHQNQALETAIFQSLNELDTHGLTMLHKAIIKNDTHDVSRLLKTGVRCDVHSRKHGYSPLCFAIMNTSTSRLRDKISLEIVSMLLEKGTDVNETISIFKPDDDGTAKPLIQCNILHLLLFNDVTQSPKQRMLNKNINLDLVKLLLKHGVDLTVSPLGDPEITARNIPNLLADASEQSEVILLLREHQRSLAPVM